MTPETAPALAPEFAEMLAEEEAAAEDHPQLWDVPLAEAREFYRAMMTDGRTQAALAPVAETVDGELPLPGGPRPTRLYRPLAPRGRTVVYFHGGGWVLGDLDTHDPVARVLCDELGAVVVAVDAPLAPETPFPGPVTAAKAAVTRVAAARADLGGPGSPLIVAGDSSGANIAAAAVRHLAREEPGLVNAQFLLYPATDLAGGHPDTLPYATGHWLEAAHLRWFVRQYLPDPALASDPDASPALAPGLDVLPPTALVTAQFDVLRGEGARYAEALREAGVRVRYRDVPGMIHGFFGFTGLVPAAREAARLGCADLAELLDTR
ncbi:alpha/beta hydrolase [Actinomadura vinacea]|uniref:Alpha/beta hydrolase n=1 Tax=Actinomadura vinacea TaxID=115336 RepID=A0ABN3JQN7_9ACTN